MLRFYEQLREAGCSLEPDGEFLADPALGRYMARPLGGLGLPEGVHSFLTQVGLPDCFAGYRSPDEERDDGKQVTKGTVFWISCLRIETVKRKKLLVIGESRALGRTCVTSGFETPEERNEWLKSEDVCCIAVELKTGAVWKWIHDSYEDILIFVNSSLSQYLLAMALWRSFYPGFAGQVEEFCAANPKKTELDFIFKNSKTLYAPFREALQALDPEAARKRQGYWRFMCDLSLY